MHYAAKKIYIPFESKGFCHRKLNFLRNLSLCCSLNKRGYDVYKGPSSTNLSGRVVRTHPLFGHRLLCLLVVYLNSSRNGPAFTCPWSMLTNKLPTYLDSHKSSTNTTRIKRAMNLCDSHFMRCIITRTFERCC